MANATQPWLEDLSEEWVVQPTLATLARDVSGLRTTSISQSVPPKAKSRLPRMRQSSGSFSELHGRSVGKDLHLPKQRNVLVERSLSDNNITSSSPIAPQHTQSRSASFTFSSVSQGSVMNHGTVAHHTVAKSPAKEKGSDDTPEWRRRLVKGELGYGDQMDLFGPTGLENIFHKPTADQVDDTQATQQANRKLVLSKHVAIPSSPPPWPKSVAEDDHGIGSAVQDQDVLRDDIQDGPSQQSEANSIVQPDDSISGPSQAGASQVLPRTASGQIEFENESFSPVLLTNNLMVGQTPGPNHNFRGSELANRLRQIGSPPVARYPPVHEDSMYSQGTEAQSAIRIQSVSSPDGILLGTPDISGVGRFVELRRGGYSRDGSFRRRPLSPSPEKVNTSQLSQANAGVRVAQMNRSRIPVVASSPQMAVVNPKTPRSQANNYLSPERAKNSGSPLKLFDAHDTFTSNRLQRRLSQLENKPDTTDFKQSQATGMQGKEDSSKPARLSFVEEVSGLTDGQTRRVSAFGGGDLNGYQFSGDYSADLSHEPGFDDSAPENSPPMSVAPPGSRQPFKFHLESSPTSRGPSGSIRQSPFHTIRSNRTVSQSSIRIHRTQNRSPNKAHLEAPSKYADGKRGPTSPFKHPTSKRRRTLPLADEEGSDRTDVSDNGMKAAQESHATMQLVVGRKRKDARHDSINNVADADTLARRHILRPRNPTPSQRRRDEIHAEIMEATEAFIQSSPKLNTIREQLEPSIVSNKEAEEVRATKVATEVAAFSMRRQQAIRDESRKRSVTTQDFLDEALKIMDFIRTKGRPTSGLGSLEETEAESALHEVAVQEPSSSLTFERPPSREGRTSAWREPNKQQLDSLTLDHLQKYQEKESETFLNSSVNSLRFAHVRAPSQPEDESVIIEQGDIRIVDNPNRPSKVAENNNDRMDSQPRSNRTQHSTGSSLGQTVATSASRRSEHVATLAPEAVAHLIPEQIAGMSFDRDKNIWVRQKSPSKEHRHHEQMPSSLNDSEDDPFGNIPDLTVDEVREQNIRNGSPVHRNPTAETFLEETEEREEEEEGEAEADEERPVTREGRNIVVTDTSSVPSKVSNFAWSCPKPIDSRATSWSTQPPRSSSTHKMAQAPATAVIPESEEDDIEHEIRYFENRVETPPRFQRAQVRDITISIMEPPEHRLESEETKGRLNAFARDADQIHPGGVRTLPHDFPISRPTFTGDGDLSLLDAAPSKNYRMQVSMSVSAPVLPRPGKSTSAIAPSSPVKGDYTFMLSDLPEFTLNQVDECELPDRVVVKHDGSKFTKTFEDRHAQGTAALVKALQDVEPDEPYWEDLRKVNVSGRQLTSLYRLDEMCPQLEELDISKNTVSQVKGVPFTTRKLWAEQNCLNGLTSWAALMNLQHLDISNNEMDCLDGLADLLHLRVLKVDNNKLKSLGNIMGLDGLMELSAKGNEIASVDFGRANFASLTDLDLRNNRLLEVRNLHRLPRLQHLDLDDNDIEEFPLMDLPSKPCFSLRSIRLCRNGTRMLDLKHHFPNLEMLYVDGNSLTQICGLEDIRSLRTLSARDQILDEDAGPEICTTNLFKNLEVRSLHVSLNQTHCLNFTQHLLSLQRLEAASMGLKELPSNFGKLAPNLRTINLNFNSIRDLRPLLNIKRLSELLVAGNKLERLRSNAMVLGKLGTVTKLDWRDNPLTLRFYASTSENRLLSLRRKPSDEQIAERFVLPLGDIEEDECHLERLDYETRIRRRVTEMMLANFCQNLQDLDGLPFDKARILVKDDVWERLLLLGVLRRKESDGGDSVIRRRITDTDIDAGQ